MREPAVEALAKFAHALEMSDEELSASEPIPAALGVNAIRKRLIFLCVKSIPALSGKHAADASPEMFYGVC